MSSRHFEFYKESFLSLKVNFCTATNGEALNERIQDFATNGIFLKKIFDVGSRKNEVRMLNSVDENLRGSETMKAENNIKYY